MFKILRVAIMYCRHRIKICHDFRSLVTLPADLFIKPLIERLGSFI